MIDGSLRSYENAITIGLCCRPTGGLSYWTAARKCLTVIDMETETPTPKPEMTFWDWVLGSIPLVIAAGLIIAFMAYWIWTQNHPGVVIDFTGVDPGAR